MCHVGGIGGGDTSVNGPNLGPFGKRGGKGIQGRRVIQISRGLAFTHRINPNISLTVPGIDTK